ncbi:GNAT family N-acetyltransferase [Paraoerskovia marina]|uniref:GNAT family N-acetyltransferase n=1 Tax=Paraoerskovia marina TaxID=545619 RepID=UPI000492BDAA|nr:GNAT family N-acetyltransferase [Paraoerskovia marina]
MSARTFEVRPVVWDHPDADRLRRAQRAELDERYGCDDHEPGAAPTTEDIAVFVLARDATGAPVACGGLRLLDVAGPPSAEIKRMFVVPASRGSGVASVVLRALEDAASERGVRRLVLETGTEQPDAVRFYEREGYSEIPLYGPYVGSELSRCFARTLD